MLPFASLLAASVFAASPAQAEAAPSIGAEAARGFQSICLANRTAGAAAALAAARALPGAVAQPDLPIGRGVFLKVVVAPPLEYGVREERRGFNCFVMFAGDESEAQAAVAALDASSGAAPAGSRNPGRSTYDWTLGGSRDKIRLFARYPRRGRVLIQLEVKE
jgi:hypothetical protein